jgi:O-antigen/teichoic acid export membrane protein
MDARLRRDVAWNLGPILLLAGVGLGMNFAIAWWWDAAALGVFNLVTIPYFAFAVLGACGMQYSVLRAIAEYPDDRDRVAAVVVGALVPNLALAAVAALAFVGLRGVAADVAGSDAVAAGMLYAAPGLFCFAVNKVLFGVVNGLRRMRAFAIYTALRYLLLGAGLVIAHVANVSGDHLAVIWTFTEGTLLIVLVCELLANVALGRARGWWTWARAHLHYGSRGVTATLAYEINTKLDVWMLGAAGFTTGQVGIYALAAALNDGATQLSVVVQNNVNPLIAHSIAEDRRVEVDGLVRRTRRWFVPAMAAACVLGALAYPYLIPRMTGNSTFAAGATPFAILMAGLVLASPWLPFGQIMLMADRPGWHTVLMLLVVATNFVANIALIPLFGLEGAAASTSIAVVAGAIFVRRLARGRIGVRL